MTSGTFNKWAGAILSAALVVFGTRTLLVETMESHPPEKPGFAVADQGGEGGGEAQAAAPADVPDPPVADLLKAASADAGLKLVKPCLACHTFEKGGANKTGPALYGVVNRPVAGVEGYAYTDAMKKHGGNWDYAALYAFLKAPKVVVDGTKMAFAGYKKPEDRANLIAYLRSLADSPAPLP